jgi:putative ABC transport system permease protein
MKMNTALVAAATVAASALLMAAATRGPELSSGGVMIDGDDIGGVVGPITGDPARDEQIHDELAQHCSERVADLTAAGLAPDEAVGRTILELHEMARQRAPLAAAIRLPPTGAARMTLSRFVSQLCQDVRYAARLLRRTPAASCAVVLTLALSIGATAAVFSVIKGVLLNGLPYPDAERLVHIWEVSPTGVQRNVVSSGNYLDWRDRAKSFSDLGAYLGPYNIVMTGIGDPERVEAAFVTGSLLQTLGRAPQLGRLFEPAELVAGGPRAVILSNRFWQRRFSADPGVISRSVVLDGTSYSVVGVMPPTFRFPRLETDVLVASRFADDARQQRRAHSYSVIARLAPGISIEGARTELGSIAAQLAREYPADMKGWGVNIVPAHADAVRDVRTLLWLMFAVTAVVLLVACANLANLQLARASQRAGEVAVRTAIGAGRGRLMLQFLTENVLLASLGGLLGLATVAATLQAILALAPADVPFLDAVRLDAGVCLFSAGVTLVSAILMGLAPSWHLSRARVATMLQSVRVKSDRGQSRLRHSLVSAQVALALVLLVAAALLVRSMWRLHSVNPGFDPSGVVAAELNLPAARYADNAAQIRFYEALIERVAALPRVTGVATTSGSPGGGSGASFSFAIEGRVAANPSGREDPEALHAVSAGYFDTMRIPIVAGRGFDARVDRTGGVPVVIINEALARKHWAKGDAVGQRLAFRQGQTPWLEIIGVVGDTRDAGLADDPLPTLYVPLAQKSWAWMSFQTLVVRSEGDPSALIPSLRAEVRTLDADLPVLSAATMEEALAKTGATRRFAMQLFGGFAIVALLLGAIGIYGVLSYSVSSRRQEIGIRMALGAQPSAVCWSVLRPVWMATAAGVILGGVGAALTTKFLAALLYGVPPRDLVSFATMAAALVLVAVAASWWPARRATRLDPVSVLRDGN